MNSYYSLRITKIETNHKNTIIIECKHQNQNIHFIAGQYGNVSLTPEFQKTTSRHMSIASGPEQNYVRFMMRIDSQSEFKTGVIKLKIGDVLYLQDIKGKFVLPESTEIINTKLVFIAGGVGITPFISMLEYLTMFFPQLLPQVTLIHIEHDCFVGEEIYQSIPLQSKHQLSFEDFEQELVTFIVDDNTLFYISGSPRFVMGVRSLLLEQQITKKSILLDSFAGYNN